MVELFSISPRPHNRPRALVVGDSHVLNGNYTGDNAGTGLNSRSIFGWLNALRGSPYRLVGHYGYSGDELAEVVDRLPALIEASAPVDLIVLIATTNDFGSNAPADVYAALITAHGLANAAGAELLFLGPPAMERTDGQNSRKQNFLALLESTRLSGFSYCDIQPGGIDYTGTIAEVASAKAAAADMADTSHPTARQCLKLAKYAHERLPAWNLQLPRCSSTGRNITASGVTLALEPAAGNNHGDSRSLAHNSCMAGTPAAVSSPFTGELPAGYTAVDHNSETGGPEGVMSVIANADRTDGRPGNMVLWTYSGASNAGHRSGLLNTGELARIDNYVGKRVRAQVYVEAQATVGTINGLSLTCSLQNSSFANQGTLLAQEPFSWGSATHQILADGFAGFLCTEEVVLTASMQRFDMRLKLATSVSGEGTIRIGNMDVVVLD